MQSLREKLFGKVTSFAERLGEKLEKPMRMAASVPDAVREVYGKGPGAEEVEAAPEPESEPIILETRKEPEPSRIIEAIAHNETRGIENEEEKYTYRKPSGDPKMGDDIGKYQVTEAELDAWSDDILGRQVTAEEFQNSPELQEEYIQKKVEMIRNDVPDITDEEILALHRGGLTRYMDPDVRKKKVKQRAEYVESGMGFLSSFNINNEPKSAIKKEDEQQQGETISAYNPSVIDKISKGLDTIKSKIPFMETNFESAMKKSIKDSYPFTDEATKIIDDLEIKDRTTEILSPFVKDEFAEETGNKNIQAQHRTFRGPKTADFYFDNKELLDRLPKRFLGAVVGEEINLKDLSAAVATHEVLHAMFARRNISPQNFFQDFTEAEQSGMRIGKNQVPLDAIRGHVGENYTDENMTFDQHVNELFAYVGQEVGQEGLKALPPELQKYYVGIFE